MFTRAFDEDLTLFSIPGDEGVYGCVRSTPEEFHDLLAVWYPGSHPLVVSVGGTYQWRLDDGSYHREATWAGPMSGEATGRRRQPLLPDARMAARARARRALSRCACRPMSRAPATRTAGC